MCRIKSVDIKQGGRKLTKFCLAIIRKIADKSGILALILLFFSSIAQLSYVLVYSVNVIFWDQFDYIPLLNDFSWKELFAQHNEHRLLFPKLFFVALAKLTKWDVRFETFFNWLFLQCSCLLLYAILKKNIKKGHIWIIAISLCCFLAPKYTDDLLWGFQNSFQMNLLAVLLAAFILSRIRPSNIKNILCILCCVVATFSGANGILVWFILLPLLFIRDENVFVNKKESLRHWRIKITSWVTIAIFIMIIYF